MKLLFFCVALCLHLAVVKSQGQCYDGSSRDGVGNMTVVSCDFAMESCMTKIELNHGVTILTRQCLQTKACGSHTANNEQQCYSDDAVSKEVQLCYFCCNDANLCNDFATIPPQPIQPTEEALTPPPATPLP
uniref:UPAR/Ly6 domain-containing protein n=1 Tax=Ciona savignyi TaxID=51511 RepID=H2YHS5_CIOSA